jgi:hypothetical protein
MVHFPGLTRTRLCIQRAVTWFYQDRFPYSEIPGSKPACGSPRLIAACHVLLRLLVPRHPPYALSSLTIKLTQHVSTPRGIETLKTIATNGLASHPGTYFRGDALFQASFKAWKLTRSTNARQVRLSTLRYSRAKICGLLRHATLKSHNVMPASISFQRSSFRSSTSDRNVSAPGGARLQFGAEAAGNKKPGVERRATPSFAEAAR